MALQGFLVLRIEALATLEVEWLDALYMTAWETKVKAEDIINRIKVALPSADVKAYDMTGGGDHWQLTINASEFSGLSLVEQHQLVYKALGEWMHGPIHALALTTKAV